MDLGATFPNQSGFFESKEYHNDVPKDAVCIVYQHINKINGFVYVGVTNYSENPNKRWRGGSAYKPNEKFYNAIKKYGWKNFEHFCEYYVDREQAYSREIELIKFYKDNQISYNIANGGEGANAVSEETREKLRQYSPWIKGRHHTLEARKKISEAGMGRKMSEKNKLAISIANHLRKHVVTDRLRESTRQRCSKPVYQIDKNTDEIIAEFPSAIAAEIALRGHKCGHITEVCLGRPMRKTYCGFKWRYKDGNV